MFVHLVPRPLGHFPAADSPGQNVGFAPWQLVSYAFLHGELMHLFLNMFALWMFGRALVLLLY